MQNGRLSRLIWALASNERRGAMTIPSTDVAAIFRKNALSDLTDACRSFVIHLRLENPKIGRIDDAEVIRDRIAVSAPVFGDGVAQEAENGGAEIVERWVTSVVGDVFVHQAP